MEEWFVKENGGAGELVGIASTRSNWFIAENMLRKNAELVCSLFNAKNIASAQQSLSGSEQSSSPKCPYCKTTLDGHMIMTCPKCGWDDY